MQNSAHGQVHGYASVFNVRDFQDDLILPGAFTQSIQEFNARREFRGEGSVKMHLHHDPWEEIGTWQQLEEDAHGLWVEGVLNQSCAGGINAQNLIHKGELNSLSIGFVGDKSVRKAGFKIIHTLTLLEISLVFHPANFLAHMAGDM